MKHPIEKQMELNFKLRTLLESLGIKNLHLTSLGNSIASGYSMNASIEPLLYRNMSLNSIMRDKGIDVETAHFARAQNNNDEHVLGWLNSNIALSEIYAMNRSDYSGGQTSMDNKGYDKSKEEIYFPHDPKKDIRLKDFILETEDALANIVIYNGGTGAFLDNVTRGGKHILSGFKRDFTNIQAILNQIQQSNREKETKTQVYLCGAPNFMGIGLTEIINAKLRKIPKEFANVTFVEPVKSDFLYFKDELGLSRLKSMSADIHYSDDEYLEFINYIIEAIIDNYLINDTMIKIDRELCELNHDIEFSTTERRSAEIDEILDNIVRMHITSNKTLDKIKIRKRLKQYIFERFPYDYYYIGKDKIKESRLLMPGYQKKIGQR